MVHDMALRYWVTCSGRFEIEHFKAPSKPRPLKMKAHVPSKRRKPVIQ